MKQGTSSPDYLGLGFEMLDRELRFLTECLSEVLTELGHHDLAEHLPWLGKTVAGASAPWRLGLAYSVAFQLLNMVEEHAAGEMRTLRERNEGNTAERGLWGQQIARLRAQGLTPEEMLAAMKQVRVEPVLTAHPTEAKRLAVLHQHRLLFGLLDELVDAEGSLHVQRGLRERVKAALERLWRTGEILLEKPTLADERRNVLHYLRDVFPSVLPALDDRLFEAWQDAGFDPEPLFVPGALPRIRFGTWVGGDRDGHPGVTAEITAETLAELRAQCRQRGARAVDRAGGEALALHLDAGSAADAANGARRGRRSREARPAVAAVHREPDRETPRLRRRDSYTYSARAVAGPRPPLAVAGGGGRASARARPTWRRCAARSRSSASTWRSSMSAKTPCFTRRRSRNCSARRASPRTPGTSGASRSGCASWSASCVRRGPSCTRAPSAGPEADAVLGCYRALASHMERCGANGIGSLIVSMTRRLSDLLVVYLLAREAGLHAGLPGGERLRAAGGAAV